MDSTHLHLATSAFLGSALALAVYNIYQKSTTTTWKDIASSRQRAIERSSPELRKMTGGQRYHVDEGLMDMLVHAHRLCDQYNQAEVSSSERSLILSHLLGAQGKGAYVEAPVHVDYGFNITVGDNFYCNFNCILLDCAKITVGNNVFLAPGVQLLTATHPVNAVERRSVEFALPVTIGDDVWIGANALVLPGVTVGSRVVIAAGAVVNKNVPSDVVVAGVPAKVVKRLLVGNPGAPQPKTKEELRTSDRK